MAKDKVKVLKEEINLVREELDQIIFPGHILTRQSLSLSKKLDKLILKYYNIEQSLRE